ncbi:MAG: nuclear transport factor 2 family protein [Myxococcota bacterium]
MDFRIPHTLLAMALASAGCTGRSGVPAASPVEAVELSHAQRSQRSKALVVQAVTALFADFDTDAAASLLAEDYIQHNPGVPTGAAAVIGFLPSLEDSGLTATPHRIIADGDLVVLHSTYNNADLFGGETLIGFDIFRVEDGKLAEHWDNLQAPPDQTVSGRSMVDGPTAVIDLDRTEANRAHVTSFTESVLLGGQFDRLPEYINPAPGAYHQHNPDIGDGLDGLGAGFAALAESGRAISYTTVHTIVAEGNFVFTMSEGTMGDEPTAFFDLFRLEDGLIVEHWDTIAAIPPDTAMAHNNGKF